MGDPELKARLIAESTEVMESIREIEPMAYQVVNSYERQYLLGDPVDYEPTADRSIAARAEANGVEPIEELYERLRDRDGEALMMMPFLGYAHGNGDALHEMLTHPAAVLGLADGGAHANFICDASTPTWMLTHWVRDRTRGPKLPLAHVIKKMTADTAALFDLTDRGVLAVGQACRRQRDRPRQPAVARAAPRRRPSGRRHPVAAGRRGLRRDRRSRRCHPRARRVHRANVRGASCAASPPVRGTDPPATRLGRASVMMVGWQNVPMTTYR